MNELYNKTIEVDGKIYHYDPDQDIYYRRYQQEFSERTQRIIVGIMILFVIGYVIFLR